MRRSENLSTRDESWAGSFRLTSGIRLSPFLFANPGMNGRRWEDGYLRSLSTDGRRQLRFQAASASCSEHHAID